ncbi:MAG TPA: hypothetical protein VFH56_00125 [Acidimicrobiales bacterium]|nr:hypothetical protein [Acidimicrobiales bacterium]
MTMNPLALLLIALCTVIGALFFGSWLWGLLVGLALVAVASLLSLAKL